MNVEYKSRNDRRKQWTPESKTSHEREKVCLDPYGKGPGLMVLRTNGGTRSNNTSF